MATVFSFLACCSSCFCLLFVVVTANVDEITEEYALRREDARRRQDLFPNETSLFVPDTHGWKHLMQERMAQVSDSSILEEDLRRAGWIETINSAFLIPNFTKYGFGFSRAPETLTNDIRQAIQEELVSSGIKSGKHDNHSSNNHPKIELKKELYLPTILEGPRPFFINNGDLAGRALNELKPYVEAWSGLEVVPFQAYGFRVYQNQSVLHMHTDKVHTHVLSVIYHLDSESHQPWPLYIEDFRNGKTHAIVLEPGDLLFYESAKCFHGRPKPFEGKFYTSLFLHYYPIGWKDYVQRHVLQSPLLLPPPREENATSRQRVNKSKYHYTELEVVGVAMKEPNCPNQWCRTRNAIRWNGGLVKEEGVWMSPNWQKYWLFPQQRQQRQQQKPSTPNNKDQEL